MYVIQNRLTDGAYETIPGKFQFGELSHAKKAIEKYYGELLYFYKENTEWHAYDNHDNFIARILKMKSNPKGRKKMAKKKRSAKQLANDKRLGRMAKARAKMSAKDLSKAKWGKKKVSKRKTNPKRTSLKKSHLWLLFRCGSKKVQFFNGNPIVSKQWGSRGKAILFRTRGHASVIAQKLIKPGLKIYGAAPENTLDAKIKEHCGYKSGK